MKLSIYLNRRVFVMRNQKKINIIVEIGLSNAKAKNSTFCIGNKIPYSIQLSHVLLYVDNQAIS